jgi:ribosomal protein S12 methylthiotransferase
LKEARFERFGAFPYSAEEGTVAATLPNAVPEQTKQDRYDILMQTQTDVSRAIMESAVGKTVTVLVEGRDPYAGMYVGRSPSDAPDVDGKVFFTAKKRPSPGDFVTVRITDAEDYDLIGVAE